MNSNNFIGKKFGRLTVISFYKKEGKKKFYVCKCECGKEKIVNYDYLVCGTTKSCGCLRNEMLIKFKRGYYFHNKVFYEEELAEK